MTSKEALQRIKDDFEIKYDNLKNEKDRQNIIGLCEVIENDLEVLEIAIKYNIDWEIVEVNRTYLQYRAHLKHLCFDECQIPNEEEFKILKECLKNEKM